MSQKEITIFGDPDEGAVAQIENVMKDDLDKLERVFYSTEIEVDVE